MNIPWGPVVFIDMAGSVLMLLLSCGCARYAWQLSRNRPGEVFHNYIFLFTLAMLFFAVSRSFGHLIKQLLLMNNMADIWRMISPFSGAVNSTAFVVIFALSLSFHRFQKVHTEIEHYRNNLEEMIASRTEELEQSRNTLKNILDNSNPINITDINHELIQANEAYYDLWPDGKDREGPVKCYESRPGAHCHTENCPLKLVAEGHEAVVQEVTKKLNGDTRDFIVTAKPFRDVDGRLIGMIESFVDITLRKQAERALRESEERFRQIFESNPDPVLLTKVADGIIIDVNRAFETATGIARSEAVGHSSEELGFWAKNDFRAEFRAKLQNNGEVNNFETTFRVTDGQVRTGLASACNLIVGNEPCILLVIRDITTEKAAERALVEMDRIKSEFISTAAHELSTPLSTMMGYTEFLRNPVEFGGFTEEQKQDFVNEVYENGEALSRIIEDLLDISRIESGKPIPLVQEKTDMAGVLAKKVHAYQTHDTAHTYHLDLPDSAGRSEIVIDRHRINQVLENLLSNASKYSAKGSAIFVRGRENAHGWEVSIEDLGVGMNPEQLNRVFDKFYRANASNTAIKGLGLGMSIAKQVVEAHGGQIQVESVEGQGTTVTFTLPDSASEADFIDPAQES